MTNVLIQIIKKTKTHITSAAVYHQAHLVPFTDDSVVIRFPLIRIPCLEKLSTFRYSDFPWSCQANLETDQRKFLVILF